jgi:NADH dehydrogenase
MKKVVIIGGGYSGLAVVESLMYVDDIEIVLIDKNNYQYQPKNIYRYISGDTDFSTIFTDLMPYLQKFPREITFIHDEVCLVDTDGKKLKCKSTKEISFDYLVICAGAETDFLQFEDDLKPRSYGLKTVPRALALSKAFDELLYQSIEESNRDKIFHLAIIGAGLSGVEIAATMATLLAKQKGAFEDAKERIKIHLIEASDQILPEMDSYIVKNSTQRLKSLGVEIMLNSAVSEVLEDKVIFRDGGDISFDLIIFAGGIRGAKLNELLFCELNYKNQIIADKYLNFLTVDYIFAAGDCVELVDRDGNVLPSNIEMSKKSADYVATSIGERLRGVSSKPYDFSKDSSFVWLGDRYVVGKLNKYMGVKGYLGCILSKIK